MKWLWKPYILIGKITIIQCDPGEGKTTMILEIASVRADPSIRVMAQIKSSLAPEGKKIAFKLDEENGFVWIGEYEAEKLIKEVLDDGAKASDYVVERAKEKQISQRTLKTAKKNLEVKSIETKEGWKWQL